MQSNEHTSKQFDTELEAIRKSVLEMGELVKIRSVMPSTRLSVVVWL